jgi:hypothetical protein
MSDTRSIDEYSIGEVKIFLRNYFNQYKRLPTIREAADRFSTQESRMLDIYRSLVRDGFLKRNYTRYKMPVPQSEQSSREKVPGIVVTPSVQKEAVGDIFITAGWMIVVLRLVMTLIVLGAVSLSIYYTAIWLMDFLPAFLAIVLSSVMVLFSCMAFEIVILLGRSRQKILASVFLVLWAVVLIFSMVSTVAGQYNQRIHNEVVATARGSEMTYKRTLYESYQAEEKNLQKQIEDKMEQRTSYQKLLSQFDTLEKQQEDRKIFNDLTWRIAVVDREVQRLNGQLSSVREKERSSLEGETQEGLIRETVSENQSFYVWIGTVFNVSPIHVEFWLSVFPAVFIDIIAPFALAFVLFVQKRMEGKKSN